MKKLLFRCAATSAMALLMLTACQEKKATGPNLGLTNEVMQKAEKALKEKADYLGLRADSLITFPDSLPEVERKALTYLMAYEVTPDMLDYDAAFHLRQVRATLQALRTMPWGKSIPGHITRHFILPIRVNNEALDDSRTTFYEELKERVQSLSMYDAILEVNHWCRERVTYQPSDGRTSSPLNTRKNALGRCGEESTFTVAALRAVGIPARQVYTPRWAHTDDNHAWVEAWADGKWYYLGACEPAPVLNNAWFDAPVKRSMMLHTKAFGDYMGDEEVLSTTATHTELNLTPLYVSTGKVRVRVMDAQGRPVPGIKVCFRLYNYAEFFPLAQRETDNEGRAQLETGLGTLVVTAGNDLHAMAFAVAKAGEEEVTMHLKPYDSLPHMQQWKLVPPPAKKAEMLIDSSLVRACKEREMRDDSLRNAYLSTFPTPEKAVAKAQELGIKDGALWEKIFVESRGNHPEVLRFMQQLPQESREHGLKLLSSLTSKDLHDITCEVATDALKHYKGTYSDDEVKRMLCPRVGTEQLFPVGGVLDKTVEHVLQPDGGKGCSALQKAQKLAAYLQTFRVDEVYNPIRHALSPATVLQRHMGDALSIAYTFVRLCRTAGIQAEYDGTIGLPRIFDEQGRYHHFALTAADKSKLKPQHTAQCNYGLSYQARPYLSDPKYYYNFTLGYISPQGQPVTYGMPDGMSYKEVMQQPLEFTHNFVLTGTRLADGSVLARWEKLDCGRTDNPLVFDADTTAIAVIGSMNPEQLYYDYATRGQKTLLSSTGRGYFVLCLGLERHEPTDHILRDLKKGLQTDTGTLLPVVVLMKQGSACPDKLVELFPQAIWGTDIGDANLNMIMQGTEQHGQPDYPLVAVCDTFGRIVFVSQGYTIGLEAQIMRVVSEVK